MTDASGSAMVEDWVRASRGLHTLAKVRYGSVVSAGHACFVMPNARLWVEAIDGMCGRVRR